MDSGDSPSRRAAQSTIVEFPIKRSRLIPFTRYVLNLGRSLFIGGLILICCSKAAGVTEFFDAMMNHWEKPLKELSAQRMRRRSEGHTEVIEIPDDDCKSVSMDELEKQSLQKAQEGIIIVDGDDLLADDGYANPEEIANGEVPEAMPKPEEKPNTMTEKKATIEEKPEEKPALEEPNSPDADNRGKDQSVDAADADAKALAAKRREELIKQLVLLSMEIDFQNLYNAWFENRSCCSFNILFGDPYPFGYAIALLLFSVYQRPVT